jgi:hypothetical protein
MSTIEFQLGRNAFGRLALTLPDGEAHEGVLPVRAFPIGAPEEGVSPTAANWRGSRGSTRCPRCSGRCWTRSSPSASSRHASSGSIGCPAFRRPAPGAF